MSNPITNAKAPEVFPLEDQVCLQDQVGQQSTAQAGGLESQESQQEVHVFKAKYENNRVVAENVVETREAELSVDLFVYGIDYQERGNRTEKEFLTIESMPLSDLEALARNLPKDAAYHDDAGSVKTYRDADTEARLGFGVILNCEDKYGQMEIYIPPDGGATVTKQYISYFNPSTSPGFAQLFGEVCEPKKPEQDSLSTPDSDQSVPRFMKEL